MAKAAQSLKIDIGITDNFNIDISPAPYLDNLYPTPIDGWGAKAEVQTKKSYGH